MYGLPQAGIIAQELLQERLAKVGYHQIKIIPGLWTHKTRKICFTLVVDNFAIKYTKFGRCTTSNQCSQKGLQHNSQLGCNKIYRTHHQVGLCKPQSTRAHAQILVKGPTTIQPPATKKKAELTIPPCCTPIWSKDSVHTRC
jgi:hypothetical protein